MLTENSAFALGDGPIRGAFSDGPLPEKVAQVYEQILDRTKDLAEINRRSVFGLLLVSGSAELLTRAGISGLQLGPFEITDLSAIRIVLPLMASYLIYDIATNSIKSIYSRHLLIAINHAFRRSLHDGQYVRLTYPHGAPLFGPLPWYESQTRTYWLIEKMTIILRIGSMAVPPLLISRWYYGLFRVFGFKNPLLWLSTTTAIGFIVFAILLILEANRSNLINSPLGGQHRHGSSTTLARVARRSRGEDAESQLPGETPDE
jgi:hypothetical protein